MKKILGVLSASVLLASAISAIADEVSLKTTQLSTGIYMLQGEGGFTGGNILLSVGDDGVVMIDDGLPPFLDLVKKSVKAITTKEVDYLINTHIHGDHTGNNAALAKGHTHIVSHQNMRSRMATTGVPGVEGAVPKVALPVITFSEQMTFHLNGADAQLHHIANAHTDGDTYVVFKNQNIIHTGDAFFNGMFPYIDLGSGGSVSGYLAAQKAIYNNADNQTKIVPGHGPLANKSDLKSSIDMLEDSISRIENLIKKGLSEDDVVAKNPLVKYHEKWNWGFITTEKMTRTLYKGLGGKEPSMAIVEGEHNH